MKDRIRTLMKTYGLNQSQFSNKTGIHAATLSQMLNFPERQVKSRYIEKILAVFPEINADWLIAGDEPMYKSELCLSNEGTLFSSDNAKKSTESQEFVVKEPLIDREQIGNKPVIITNTVSKKVERIVIYYSDKTFEEFFSSENR